MQADRPWGRVGLDGEAAVNVQGTTEVALKSIVSRGREPVRRAGGRAERVGICDRQQREAGTQFGNDLDMLGGL